MTTQAEDADEADEQMICPSCHAPNSPLAGFCVACRAPLNSTVMLDPMGQIEAEGFALREATLGKPRLIVVVGIWLLLFPMGLASGVIAAMILIPGHGVPANSLAIFTGSSLTVVVCAVILYQATANYRRRSRERIEAGRPPDPVAEA